MNDALKAFETIARLGAEVAGEWRNIGKRPRRVGHLFLSIEGDPFSSVCGGVEFDDSISCPSSDKMCAVCLHAIDWIKKAGLWTPEMRGLR